MRIKIKVMLLKLLKLTLIGFATGFIIGIYKLFAHHIIHISSTLMVSNDILTKTMAIIFCVLLIFISYFITRWDICIQGNGIPQLKTYGYTKDERFNPQKSLPLMFLNSSISFYIGMPLGSEAPSVYMGGCIGSELNKVFNDDNLDDMKIAMSAGFASAFVSPISGFFYAFEETLRSFSIIKIIKVAYVMFICYITSLIVNPDPILSIEYTIQFDLTYWYLFAFIIGFNYLIAIVILYIVPIIKKFILRHESFFLFKYRYFVFSFICLIVYATFPILSGSGSNLINSLFDSPLWYLILIYSIYRIVMFIFSTNAGVTGGLVLPILTIGALIGYLSAFMTTEISGMSSIHYPLAILIGMVTLFAAVNRAPLTGAFMILCLSNKTNIINILPYSIVCCLIIYLLVIVLKLKDYNDSRMKFFKKKNSSH